MKHIAERFEKDPANDHEDPWNNVVDPAVALVLIIPLTFEWGWAAAILWRWIAVPIGLPALGGAQLVALSILARYLGGNVGKEEEITWAGLRSCAFRPLSWIALAYIALAVAKF